MRNEVIWFSGFLSSFAISDDEHDDDELLSSLLHQERDLLTELAQRGCRIRCIIAPPHEPLAPNTTDFVRMRLRALVEFLTSGHAALANIDWVVSPFLERSNFYVIGRLCCTEGFRAGAERGFTLTLRQTDPGAIYANVQMLSVLFARLRTLTLTTYPPPSAQTNEQDALRISTLQCLRRLLPDST